MDPHHAPQCRCASGYDEPERPLSPYKQAACGKGEVTSESRYARSMHDLKVITLLFAKLSCCIVSLLASLLWKLTASTVMMWKHQQCSSKWLEKYLQIFHLRKKRHCKNIA